MYYIEKNYIEKLTQARRHDIATELEKEANLKLKILKKESKFMQILELKKRLEKNLLDQRSANSLRNWLIKN